MQQLRFLLFLLAAAPAFAQQPAPYRPAARQINNMVHTRLDVEFDYEKRHLIGREWVTLKPYAAATDSLRLDAKGMNIATVALVQGNAQSTLKYEYNQRQLLIHLKQPVPAGEAYTVYIEYTAKPDELNVKGGRAIEGAKGLYFINPDSAVAGKPVQIWTQGEPDSNSAWFPTIDEPNQKTTQEISMTVPAKYVTLSNGQLVKQVATAPGLRTDTWKMDEPHAPYLFMMAVGDFRITKDTWRGKEVNYYLEPQYAAQARAIFGKTPRMLEFFSQRLGVDFPWNKYHQVVCRDFVAGAMENTTASLFGEHAQGSARDLLDWQYAGVEREIAHELFHQWFGDYVTAESWGQLTVNESFANFSEIIWAEHEYGPDAAAQQADISLRTYFRDPANFLLPVVRARYAEKDDMFDGVVYQKGGNILNMLRAYLGEEVFFQGLKRYLTENAFGTGEAHKLRLALEEVSGQDLNWFFTQWYYGAGHPVVTIDYAWDVARKVQSVTVKQTQAGQPFQLPFTIDYYVGGKVQHQSVMMTEASQTFTMPLAARPDLVNVDAQKVLVWQKEDHKPLAEFAYQQRHAARYLDRREALRAAQSKPADPQAQKVLLAGLGDKTPALREMAVQVLDLKNAPLRKAATPMLEKMAATDAAPQAQAAALAALGSLKQKSYAPLFGKALGSPSYRVQAAALEALLPLNPAQALARAKAFEADSKGPLTGAIVLVYGQAGSVSQWPWMRTKFDAADPNGRFQMLQGFGEMLGRIDDPTALAEGITRIRDLTVQYKRYVDYQRVEGLLREVQQQQGKRANAAVAASLVDQAVAAIEAAK
ncbi:M1 family metallopeptidase [Hymenobacter sp. 5317J-9]|uniref:M1 family metallopeptidase n=1 Tax=Hymenobacter sp. 5317J-9 TaxID=2932250 RepID=UPI001FD6DEC9|nr:M1 family metallopeptidase [Hymenobacter sp. 5317J-9]UOQ97348.1 M1 family metallopeptidase [Hymenobacter sp. 5317J-9]